MQKQLRPFAAQRLIFLTNMTLFLQVLFLILLNGKGIKIYPSGLALHVTGFCYECRESQTAREHINQSEKMIEAIRLFLGQ